MPAKKNQHLVPSNFPSKSRLPLENLRPFDITWRRIVYRYQCVEYTKKPSPEIDYVNTPRRRWCIEEVIFQSALISELQKYVIRLLLHKAPIEANDVRVGVLFEPSESVVFVSVVSFGVLGTISLEDEGVCISIPRALTRVS